jgi:hypothetical protein
VRQPTVLDTKGRAIEVGSRVRHRDFADEIPGEVKSPRWLQFSGWSLEVYWRQNPGGERVVVCHVLSVEDPEPDTYRARDLILITDDEKGGEAVHEVAPDQGRNRRCDSKTTPSTARSHGAQSPAGSSSAPSSQGRQMQSSSLSSSPCSSSPSSSSTRPSNDEKGRSNDRAC